MTDTQATEQRRGRGGRDNALINAFRKAARLEPVIYGRFARDLPPETSGHAVLLTRAGHGQCRWPIHGDGMHLVVCGAVTARGSYCAGHAVRATSAQSVK